MIYLEAITTWLRADVGGRANPVTPGGGSYRPHLVVAGDTEMLGVVGVAGPDIIHPGETAVVHLRGLYHPDVDYGRLQQGTQFLIVEGPRVVAVGKVIRAWEEGD